MLPYGITVGQDGNIWFTEYQSDQIGMINPTTHAVSEFPIPTASSGPLKITAGPDGNLWFTEFAGNQIGEINPTSHTVTEFAIPTSGSNPQGITAGPDGNIWFTEATGNKIGMINPTTHAFTEFAIPTSGSDPQGITTGSDGNIWFTESSGNNIGTINPTTHTITEYAIPQGGSQPYEITAGPNGTMWFTENAGTGIGEINTTTHAFSQYAIPTSKSGPLGITTGPDGDIWFTEYAANQIGEVNVTTGVVTETAVTTAGASPTEIIAGPGSTLWYTESSGNQIGEILADPSITTSPVNLTIVDGQTATFTAAADGVPVPSVQWQVSTNGVTFTPLTNAGLYSGVTTDTLTITDATTAMNGYEYEAVFTNGVSPTPSLATAPAILTVQSALSITPALPQGTVGTSYNHTLSVIGSTTPFNVFSVSNFNPGTTGLIVERHHRERLQRNHCLQRNTHRSRDCYLRRQRRQYGWRQPDEEDGHHDPPAAEHRHIGAFDRDRRHQLQPGHHRRRRHTALHNFHGDQLQRRHHRPERGQYHRELPGSGVFNVKGTPSAGGTATFTVTVTDSAGITVTKNFTLTVNPPLVFTPSLPTSTAGTIYNQTVTVTGGGLPYSSLSVSHFSAGATGLTLSNVKINPATAAVTINGTPTAAGSVTFTVNVIDAIGAVSNKTYTVTINPAPSITPSLPAGTAGASYHRTISVTGGTKPYSTFTVIGFNPGTTGLSTAAMTVNAAAGTIVINGTPSAAGTVAFTVNVTDTVGSHLSKVYSVTINAPPTLGNLSATQWTAGTSGFTGVIPISSGTAPFTIASSSGLPTGLTAVVTGTTIHFTGTPSSAQTFATGSITVQDSAGASVSKTFSMTINPALAIGTPTATQWTTGISGFVSALSVSGGTGGLSIASTSGLPKGLTAVLTGNTIRIVGTPTAAGAFAGSVTLRDTVGAVVTKAFTITINAPPTLGNLSTTQWTTGKSGFVSSMTIAGGTGPFTLASSSGLPTGLTAVLSGNTIRITGTPSAAQTFAAGSVTLHDASGASVTKTFSITINPPLLITTTSLPASTLAALYSATVQAKGGTGAITFAITAGSLPPGMKLSSTGVITGVSRGVGSFTVTITATDAIGDTVSQKYTLTLAL